MHIIQIFSPNQLEHCKHVIYALHHDHNTHKYDMINTRWSEKPTMTSGNK